MIHVRWTPEQFVNYREADGWHIDDGGRLHVLNGSDEVAVYNTESWVTVAKVEDQRTLRTA